MTFSEDLLWHRLKNCYYLWSLATTLDFWLIFELVMQIITEEMDKMFRRNFTWLSSLHCSSLGTGVHKWKCKDHDVRKWSQIRIGNDTGGAKDQRHSKYTIIDNVDANNCHRTTTLTFDPDITHDLDIANDLELWPWPSRSTPKFVRNNSAVHLDRAWLLSCLKRRVQDLSNGIWHPIFASAMQPIKSNQYSEYQILFSELETLSRI